ncbi:MAG TPA: pantoate--beta-alanine ligase [Solirubrobacteraceae bacterium]|jgi:pantoate--beta-alanine ligase
MSETTTAMLTLRTIAELREALRDAERPLGLVPTMGALHEGHLALLERARAQCATVVMSLFVNPTQFAPGEDLRSYPRDEDADARLAAAAGVDVLFAPPPSEMYPDGFATTIHVAGVSERLEGAARGGSHFDGVATVVAKLLNIVGPQIAYFGQKDAQQALVIRRLVRDLDMPVLIELCPTVRAGDGLALSSRNAYLGDDERTRASALHRGLTAAADAIAAGERDPDAALARARVELAAADIEPEYLDLSDPETLAPVVRIQGPVLITLAARVGGARLIDNVIATPGQEPR